MEDLEASRLPEFPAGLLKTFTALLSDDAKPLWETIKTTVRERETHLRTELSKANAREKLHANVHQALGKVSSEHILDAIKTGVEKGDAQMLRLVMQAAGIDLSEKPQAQDGEGVKVIFLDRLPDPDALPQENPDDGNRAIAA